MKLTKFEEKIIEEFSIMKQDIIVFDVNIDHYRSCIVEDKIKEKTGIDVFCSEVYSQLPKRIYLNEYENFLSDTLLYQKNRTTDKGFVKVKIL